MAEETITTYICDGCGKRSPSADFNDGSSSGYMRLSYEYHKAGKSYDGAWGGTSFESEMLLCVDCADRVLTKFRALAGEEEE